MRFELISLPPLSFAGIHAINYNKQSGISMRGEIGLSLIKQPTLRK